MKEKTNNMRVAFVSSDDPRDRKSWSGTMFRMLTALEQENCSVHIIGPIRFSVVHSLMTRAVKLFHKLRYNKKFDRSHSTIKSKFYAKYIGKKLNDTQVDLIFAPAGSVKIAYLETHIPICFLSDTTYNQIRDYYQSFSQISNASQAQANKIESLAIKNSSLQVFPSNWAADYAKEFYGAKNAHVVKFGPNLDVIPEKKDLNKDFRSTIHILFLGVDWERKGGDIVMDTCRKLDLQNIPYSLTICGCVPPENDINATVIPFLNKNIESDRKELDRILKKTNLLFVPTRAEAYGIVFCEACAYGIPILTTNTGGVPAIVEHNRNGLTLPLKSDSAKYLKIILDLHQHRDQFEQLSRNARKKYDDELNWTNWGKQMLKLFEHTIRNHS